MEQQCSTPVSFSEDEIAANTCLQIRYAYQANLDLQNYLNQWTPISRDGNGSANPLYRPSPVTQFYENNTRVVPAWVGFGDIERNSHMYGRVVNNVTLAVPHIGIATAARDPVNGILQPEVLHSYHCYAPYSTLT
jgi:hypothetical protein